MKYLNYRLPWRRDAFRGTPGAAPGTIKVDPKSANSKIHILAYGPEGCEEISTDAMDVIESVSSSWPMVWIHIEGLRNLSILQAIQTKYNLHNLAVEDVVNQNQRPKIESYDDHEHIVLLSAEPGDQISLNQVNLFLEEGLVISIMDKPGAWTAPVRKRIREGGSRIQTSGADYLGYALMDAVVDHYFPIVDGYASHLTALEKAALGHPTQQDIIDIHVVSNELMSLRRAILPLKDMTKQLHSESHARIHKKNRIYFRDCSDHVMRLLDELEADRDFSRNLVNTCLSTMSNRMNEIMKLLTVISTIFIPLSFIAGIYGMNFNPETSPYNMPELGWRFGYLFAWLLMVIIALTMLVFFRMKGWLGGSRGTLRDTRIR